MRPPFFVVGANGDVDAYDSAPAAENSVESVDVEDGEYRAAYDQHQLRAALVTKLARLGIEVPATAPLELVVAQAASVLKRR